MVAILENAERAKAFALFAHPEPLDGGVIPEERLIVCGIGWRGHLELDRALGDDRPAPRLYYLEGDLEIMSTSEEHERIKIIIGDCVKDFLLERGIPNVPRGQATMRLIEQTGAEPDESWCIGGEKTFPDLVLEIALTSGGLPKLDIYRRFAVSEVWIWRHDELEIHHLRADGASYERKTVSALLPGLPIAALEEVVADHDWMSAALR